MEFSQETATHINVKIQGLNGQLPNLDLFNLINRLCMKEGMGNLFQVCVEAGFIFSLSHSN